METKYIRFLQVVEEKSTWATLERKGRWQRILRWEKLVKRDWMQWKDWQDKGRGRGET